MMRVVNEKEQGMAGGAAETDFIATTNAPVGLI